MAGCAPLPLFILLHVGGWILANEVKKFREWVRSCGGVLVCSSSQQLFFSGTYFLGTQILIIPTHCGFVCCFFVFVSVLLPLNLATSNSLQMTVLLFVNLYSRLFVPPLLLGKKCSLNVACILHFQLSESSFILHVVPEELKNPVFPWSSHHECSS